jgi:hypothetical protein
VQADLIRGGNQPWFANKHKDLEQVQLHIVSTPIDRETGRKMQEFIKYLEQKYQLIQTSVF